MLSSKELKASELYHLVPLLPAEISSSILSLFFFVTFPPWDFSIAEPNLAKFKRRNEGLADMEN